MFEWINEHGTDAKWMTSCMFGPHTDLSLRGRDTNVLPLDKKQSCLFVITLPIPWSHGLQTLGKWLILMEWCHKQETDQALPGWFGEGSTNHRLLNEAGRWRLSGSRRSPGFSLLAQRSQRRRCLISKISCKIIRLYCSKPGRGKCPSFIKNVLLC